MYHCKAGEMKIYQIRNMFSEQKKSYRSVVSSGITKPFLDSTATLEVMAVTRRREGKTF
jgi:hypothetical protein